MIPSSVTGYARYTDFCNTFYKKKTAMCGTFPKILARLRIILVNINKYMKRM